MGRIELKHDGLEVELSGAPRLAPLLGWVGLMGVAGIAALALRAVLPWVLGAAALVMLISVAAMGRRVTRRERRVLSCDERWLTLDTGRRVNLLDLVRVEVGDRQLWFRTQAGPLPDFSFGPVLEAETELREVADVLNRAVEQAEERRGDAPDARYHEIKGMLDREEAQER